MKSVSLKAPCRIDLAGGTIDLWPLYLYFGGHTLCHMAVEIFTEVTLSFEKATKGLQIKVESKDLSAVQNYKSLSDLEKSLAKTTDTEPTRWINRLCYSFLSEKLPDQKGRLVVRCESKAPPGSGLGGSSVLGVTLWSALEELFLSKNKRLEAWDVQRRVRDLEAVEIEHPAGDQDYVPALFGGLLLFNLNANHRSIERVPSKTAEELSSRLALVYTGQRHHSGINNWELFTNFHKWGHPCRKHLAKIHKISAEMSLQLKRGRLDEFGDLLNKEWASRARLGEAVNAPSLKKAWSFARKHGASARKACGAGGGGCLLVYFPSAKLRNSFLEQVSPEGMSLYPVTLAKEGLRGKST